MQNINLFNGDCYDILESLVKKNIKFDAIICDPPFAITQNKNDKSLDWGRIWKLLYKLRKDTKTPIVLFSSELFTGKLINSNIENYKYRWFVNKIYKTNHLNSRIQPLRQIDEIVVFGDKPPPIITQLNSRENLTTAVEIWINRNLRTIIMENLTKSLQIRVALNTLQIF